MKPKHLNEKCLIKIKNDIDVKCFNGLLNFFEGCIPIFVITTLVKVHGAAKISGYNIQQTFDGVQGLEQCYDIQYGDGLQGGESNSYVQDDDDDSLVEVEN